MVDRLGRRGKIVLWSIVDRLGGEGLDSLMVHGRQSGVRIFRGYPLSYLNPNCGPSTDKPINQPKLWTVDYSTI